MENQIYLTALFDIYGELLTEKQQDYFISYYFNNYSLSEISENKNVTRNAIHNSIKEAEKNLLNYEEKLKLYSKTKRIKEELKENKELLEKIENILE